MAHARPRQIRKDPRRVVTGETLVVNEDKDSEYAMRKAIARFIAQAYQQDPAIPKKSAFVIGILGYTVTEDKDEPCNLLIAISGSQRNSAEENTEGESTIQEFVSNLTEDNSFKEFVDERRYSGNIGEIRFVTSVNPSADGGAGVLGYGASIKYHPDTPSEKRPWKCSEPKLFSEINKLREKYSHFQAVGENYFQIQTTMPSRVAKKVDSTVVKSENIADVPSCGTCRAQFELYHHSSNESSPVLARQVSDPRLYILYSNSRLYRERGNAMMNAENFSVAIQYIEHAMSMDLENGSIIPGQDRINLTRYHYLNGQKEKDPEKAVINYSKAIQGLELFQSESKDDFSSYLAAYYVERALCRHVVSENKSEVGDFDSAEQESLGSFQDLRHAMGLDPNLLSIQQLDNNDQKKIRIAAIYHEEGKRADTPEESIANYTKAIEYLESLQNREKIYLHLAIYYANRALSRHAIGDKLQDELLLALKDFQYAIELYQNVFSHFQLNKQQTIRVAAMFHKKGGLEYSSSSYLKAKESYSLAIIYLESLNKENQPQDNHHLANYYHAREECYLQLENLDLAWTDYQRAMELDPRYDPNLPLMLTPYAGYFDGTEEKLLEIEKKSNLSAMDYAERAFTYARLDQDDEAFEDFKQAIQLDPNVFLSLENNDCNRMKLANWYIQQGKEQRDPIESYSRAIRLLEPLESQQPHRYTLAMYYANRAFCSFGQDKERFKDYKRAIELDPGLWLRIADDSNRKQIVKWRQEYALTRQLHFDNYSDEFKGSVVYPFGDTVEKRGKEVSKIYWYEDTEMGKILRHSMTQYHNGTAHESAEARKPVHILGPLDNISSSYGLSNALTDHRRQRGIVLIPFNLGQFHWVGLRLEYDAKGRFSIKDIS